MSGSTAELRNLLVRLDSYVAHGAGDRAPLLAPTTNEAMATYAMATRLVEADLRRGRPRADLSIHREVLTATQRMLQAALAAQDEPAGQLRAGLQLVEDR